ncbi:MAG: class I SAM-dependent methyltransferase, partial [Mucilaginibacter polytrichastri]|nr:class I SAM-dependent methyltransferase [Mucilaginibacter polytrichastri]
MDLASAIKFFPPKTGDKISPQVWADLGCGDGLFSRALAGFLAQGSTIYAVD